MSIYDVGDRVHVSTTVTAGATGAPTDATIALTITKPDNTTSTPTPTHDGLGLYSADIDVTLPGNWLVHWVASGAAVGVDDQQFYVQPAGFRIVSLTDAKNHINKTMVYTGDDNELRGFIDTAGELVESLAGPTINRTVTEYHDGTGRSEIFLGQWPAVSVTSVVETWPGGSNYTLNQMTDLGAAGTGYDFTFDRQVGSITRRSGPSLTRCFPAGLANVKIVYVAGRVQPWPPSIRLAALEEIGYLWRVTQAGRGGGRPSGLLAEATVDVPGFGAVPVRVKSLLGGKLPPQAGA